MTRGEMCVETREGKDEMYLDAIVMSEDHGGYRKGTHAEDSAKEEHSHEGHEPTFEPLLAVLEGEAEVDDIPEEVRLS